MDYKAEADKIVEMFMPYVSSHGCMSTMEQNIRINAKICAIKSVEMVLENTPKDIHGLQEGTAHWIIVENPGVKKWKSILTELKQMLWKQK